MNVAPWTVETYSLHNEAMRVAEEKFQTERDKRYAEGNELRAMALKIKETADANALELASESQTYKEARNDAMRETNLKESGVYATRDDLTNVVKATRDDLSEVVKSMEKALKPLVDFMSTQTGEAKGVGMTKTGIYSAIGGAVGIIALIMFLIENIFGRTA